MAETIKQAIKDQVQSQFSMIFLKEFSGDFSRFKICFDLEIEFLFLYILRIIWLFYFIKI